MVLTLLAKFSNYFQSETQTNGVGKVDWKLNFFLERSYLHEADMKIQHLPDTVQVTGKLSYKHELSKKWQQNGGAESEKCFNLCDNENC